MHTYMNIITGSTTESPTTESPTTTSPTTSNDLPIAAIAGGAVGGIICLLLVVAIVVIVLVFFAPCRKQGKGNTYHSFTIPANHPGFSGNIPGFQHRFPLFFRFPTF